MYPEAGVVDLAILESGEEKQVFGEGGASHDFTFVFYFYILMYF